MPVKSRKLGGRRNRDLQSQCELSCPWDFARCECKDDRWVVRKVAVGILYVSGKSFHCQVCRQGWKCTGMHLPPRCAESQGPIPLRKVLAPCPPCPQNQVGAAGNLLRTGRQNHSILECPVFDDGFNGVQCSAILPQSFAA